MQKTILLLICLGYALHARRVQPAMPSNEAQSLASYLLSVNPSALSNPRVANRASPTAQQAIRKRWNKNTIMKAACELLEGDKMLIAPSILSADFAKLGEEVDNVLAAGADVVHFDVMDNHYVPNLTIGPMVCKALRDHGVTAPIDVHLMVSPVDQIVEDFCAAGASYITFHPEASPHIDRTLALIKEKGCKAGLVFNPGTPLTHAQYVMDKLDIILLMSVNPGFGGQKFIDGTMDKLREARKMIDESGYKIRLEIDGGVGPANIKAIKDAGADMFVAGSAILKAPRTEEAYKETIDGLRKELA
jgi:ribulose-phosphate 3-epimerase